MLNWAIKSITMPLNMESLMPRSFSLIMMFLEIASPPSPMMDRHTTTQIARLKPNNRLLLKTAQQKRWAVFLSAPPRLPIRNGTVRQARQSRAIGVDDVEFVIAITEGGEDDPVAVG